MKANKILPDLSIKKIWDKLTKHESDISQLSNPNLLINGDFQVWQRGTSHEITTSTSSKYVCCDRFAFRTDAHGSAILEKTDNGLKITSNVPVNWGQILENSYVGKTLTFSMKYIVNGVEKFFKHTFTVTSSTYVSEELVIENGLNFIPWVKSGKYLSCQINSTLASYEVCYQKLELGSIATPFVPPLYSDELIRCGVPDDTSTFGYKSQYAKLNSNIGKVIHKDIAGGEKYRINFPSNGTYLIGVMTSSNENSFNNIYIASFYYDYRSLVKLNGNNNISNISISSKTVELTALYSSVLTVYGGDGITIE